MTKQNTETTRRKVLKATTGGLAGASTLVSGTAVAQREPDLRNLMIYDYWREYGGNLVNSFESGDHFYAEVEYYGLSPGYDYIELFAGQPLVQDNYLRQSEEPVESEVGTHKVASIHQSDYEGHIEDGELEIVAAAKCMGSGCDAVSNTVTLEQTDYEDDGWW